MIGRGKTKRQTINGRPRADLAEDLAVRYRAGQSIRQMARDDLPYGTVRKLLLECGVTLRERGGDNRR